jgi:hypothetical protein
VGKYLVKCIYMDILSIVYMMLKCKLYNPVLSHFILPKVTN